MSIVILLLLLLSVTVILGLACDYLTGTMLKWHHNSKTLLSSFDFSGKQELFRLLIENVIYNGWSIEIQTIIPTREQLHLIH